MAESSNPRASTDARGSLSLFWVGMILLMVGVVILGFWPTYFGPLLFGEPVGHPKGFVESSLVIHLHGLVFLGWMGLFFPKPSSSPETNHRRTCVSASM